MIPVTAAITWCQDRFGRALTHPGKGNLPYLAALAVEVGSGSYILRR